MNYSIAEMAFICLPMAIAGLFHMVFIKLPVLNALLRPMDAGITLWDGKRLFGDNKTWKGFVGMPIGCLISFGVLGVFCEQSEVIGDLTIINYQNLGVFQNGWLFGAFMGLGYILAELPNSFIKRRIDIAPGTNKEGLAGNAFRVVDQIDSSFGCAVAFTFVIPMTFLDILNLTVVGGLLHYIFAVMLYFVGLKKQMG